MGNKYFNQIDKRLDKLILIKDNRQLTDKECIEYRNLKIAWNLEISRQEINPYEVTINKLPYTI